jgi:hypothetical protein
MFLGKAVQEIKTYCFTKTRFMKKITILFLLFVLSVNSFSQ